MNVLMSTVLLLVSLERVIVVDLVNVVTTLASAQQSAVATPGEALKFVPG